MAFKYRRRTEEEMDKRANESTQFPSFLQAEYRDWRPKKGDNWGRIHPATWKSDDGTTPHYGLDVHVHYGIGPTKASVLCLAHHPHPDEGETKCPLCLEQRKAEREGDEDLAKEMRATKRVLVWWKDKDNKDDGPQPWAMPNQLDSNIVKISRDKRTGESYYVDDPEDGYDIMFTREGEGMKTKYAGVALGRRPNAIPKKDLDYVISNPLPEILLYRTSDEIQALYDGEAAEAKSSGKRKPARRDEEEEEEAPRRARTSRRDEEEEEEERPARRRRAEPEEEEEDPPRRARRPAREEEEEEEAPPKRSTKPSLTQRAPVEEEEEEEAPPKRTGKPGLRKRDEVDDDEIPSKGRRAAVEEEEEDEDSGAAARAKRMKERHAAKK